MRTLLMTFSICAGLVSLAAAERAPAERPKKSETKRRDAPGVYRIVGFAEIPPGTMVTIAAGSKQGIRLDDVPYLVDEAGRKPKHAELDIVRLDAHRMMARSKLTFAEMRKQRWSVVIDRR